MKQDGKAGDRRHRIFALYAWFEPTSSAPGTVSSGSCIHHIFWGPPQIIALWLAEQQSVAFWGAFLAFLEDFSQNSTCPVTGERLGFKVFYILFSFTDTGKLSLNLPLTVHNADLFLIFVYSFFFFLVLGEIISIAVIQVRKDNLLFKMRFSEVFFFL